MFVREDISTLAQTSTQLSKALFIQILKKEIIALASMLIDLAHTTTIILDILK